MTTSRLEGAAAPGALAGQTAIVTGGSSGIGAGIVRAMAAAGAAVVVNYRSGGEAAEALVGEVAAGSGKNLGRYAASWIACWPKRPSSTAALT